MLKSSLHWCNLGVIVLSVLLFSHCRPRNFNDAPASEKGQGTANIHSDSFVRQPSLELQLRHAQVLAESFPTIVRLVKLQDKENTEKPAFLLRIGRSDFDLSSDSRDAKKKKRDETQNQRSTGLRPVVYLTDATHGDEYTGVVDRLSGYMAAQAGQTGTPFARFFESGGLVYIAPVVNPSGYQNTERLTREGVDLNRNFTPEKIPTLPELKNLLNLVLSSLEEDKAELRIVVDYHCCSRMEETPVLLRPTNFESPTGPLKNANAEKHSQEVSAIAKKIFGKFEVGASNVLLKKKEEQNSAPNVGTSKDYFYYEFLEKKADEKFVFSATYEGLRKSKTERNPNSFVQHFRFWEKMTEKLLP
jgi:hypothetical protein